MELYPPYDQVSERAAEKCASWLRELGYKLDSEHTEMTPYRLSWYVMRMLSANKEIHITTFANKDPRVGDMAVVPRIPILACCSHHLLPFFGYVDFGYIPKERLIGLSKIPMLIQEIARGPWMQEHLTDYLADRFYRELDAEGVIVRTQCVHTCVMLDLDSAEVPSFTLCALRGSFVDCPTCVGEFFEHLRRSENS